MLDVCLLGTGGTMPLKNRWLSSAVFRYNGHIVLCDCGEGTQIAFKSASFLFKSIDVICLTHFHADHISGLPGILLSMGNEGRDQSVLIIGPKGTRKVVSSLRIIAPELPFEIEVSEIETDEETYYFDGFTITPFEVNHRIDCFGYRIDVQRVGKFDPQKAALNNVPQKVWGMLQKEESVIYDGKEYSCDMVLGEPRRGIRAVFCTDTRPCEAIVRNCLDADLAVLEGMYGSDEKEDKARLTKHMTFAEAAQIAKSASCKRLWLTHFSTSMPDPDMYLDEAKIIFPNTQTGYDGIKDTIRFCEE